MEEWRKCKMRTECTSYNVNFSQAFKQEYHTN